VYQFPKNLTEYKICVLKCPEILSIKVIILKIIESHIIININVQRFE
jgi:hypothetical protein